MPARRPPARSPAVACSARSVVLQAEDRGRGDQLVRLLAHARQPDPDRVPHALRHRVRSGLGQLPAAPPRRRTRCPRCARARWARPRRSPGPSASSVATSSERQPAQVDAVQRAAAPQLGQRGGQRRVAADLGVAIGAEHEQRSGAARAQQEAREQQRPAIGPVEVVDHEQQRSPRGRDPPARSRPRRRGDAAHRVVGVTGLERVGEARPCQRLGERLERGEWLLRAAAVAGRCAPSASAADANCWARRVLPMPGSPGDEHDPPVAVHLHARPGRAQAVELGATADELGLVRAREAGRRRDGRRLAAAEVVQQRPRLARRRNAELRAQALGEPPAGGAARRRGRRSRRASRSAGGWAPPRADRAPPARGSAGWPRPDPALATAACSSASPSRCACSSRASSAQSSSKPSRIGARHASSARTGSPSSSACWNARVIDAEAGSFERDRVPCGHQIARRRAQRLAQLGQRDAQAGPRRFVEHVGPEARRQPAAWLGARLSAR